MSKRVKKISQSLSFFISFFVVVGGTILLVKLAQGNVLDIFSGKLRPTGLLLTDSKPAGATITLNGKQLKLKTPRRITGMTPGQFSVEYTKDGYRSWRNTNQIIAGQVTFLTYSWLLPTLIPTKTLLNDLIPQSTIQSSDHKQTVISVTTPRISLYSSDNMQSATEIYAPPLSTDSTQSVKSLTLNSVSDNGSQVLITQTYASGTSDYLLVDTSSAKTPVNLTQLFRVTTTAQLSFNPDNSNQLYWLENGSVRIIDIGAKTTGPILYDKLVYFTAQNKKLYFIQTDGATRTLYSADLGGNRKTQILAKVEASPSYQLAASHFNGADAIALLTTQSGRLSIYSDTVSADTTNGTVVENVTSFFFNHGGRYLAINQNNLLKTFDVEKQEFLTHGATLEGLSSWLWLDDYHIALVTGNKLRLVDFDGQNDELIYTGEADNSILWLNRNPVLSNTTVARGKFTEFVVTEKP